MQTKCALLEHVQVFDNFYGTTQQTVVDNLNQRKDFTLEIDRQGAEQIKKQLPESLCIFNLPPSTEVLLQRLRNWGQDDEQIITRRMSDAVNEIYATD